MKKKRYSVEYTRYIKNKKYNNLNQIETEKVLINTNSYFFAKLYFKDRCKSIIDFVHKDIDVEVLIYDNIKYQVVCRFNYYFTKNKKGLSE